MESWIINLLLVLALLLTFIASGMPVTAAFLMFNLFGAILWMGGIGALDTIAGSIYANIAVFSLVPIPMFIFLGEILFQTGLASELVDVTGKWFGRIRGSLSLIAVAAGVLFGTMSGSSMSGVAVLGSTLVPEMRSKGYSKQLSIGPILASGGLAMIIPPTILGVLLATLAQVPVGKFLIAGIIPGLLLALFYAVYILVRANLQPSLAPVFSPPSITWSERILASLSVLPLTLIIFLVIGIIFIGVATPSEAAALGVSGALVLAVAKGKLSWDTFTKSIAETLKVSSMIFFIMMGSMVFSQILAFSGVTSNLVKVIEGVNLNPIVIVMIMQGILVFLGMFIDSVSIMMITIPIFMPIIVSLNFDPIWFGILFLLNLEIGTISPPFGLNLFTMMGVVPDADIGDIYQAAIPFVILGVICVLLLIFVPELVTWLPSLM